MFFWICRLQFWQPRWKVFAKSLKSFAESQKKIVTQYLFFTNSSFSEYSSGLWQFRRGMEVKYWVFSYTFGIKETGTVFKSVNVANFAIEVVFSKLLFSPKLKSCKNRIFLIFRSLKIFEVFFKICTFIVLEGISNKVEELKLSRW